MLEITPLLDRMVEEEASDLHLIPGRQPVYRIIGEMIPDERFSPLTNEEISRMTDELLALDPNFAAKFQTTGALDFSFEIKDLARFRVSLFHDRLGRRAVLRVIPYEIRPFEELGLPEQVVNLANRPRGLVLVTGPTGSGKSTTLAAMIDLINRTKKHHIITIEDPIEFVHESKESIVTQREVGTHVASFADGLRQALRQDPDVILIGEMRDLETVDGALKAAETGHLTFATLHTNTAVSTITRIIDIFPADRQAQIRTQLSFTLQGVLCQQLLPRKTKKPGSMRRALAAELMLITPTISKLIREGRLKEINDQMRQLGAELGMQTLNQSLAALVLAGEVDEAEARAKASDLEEFNEALGRFAREGRAHQPPTTTKRWF